MNISEERSLYERWMEGGYSFDPIWDWLYHYSVYQVTRHGFMGYVYVALGVVLILYILPATRQTVSYLIASGIRAIFSGGGVFIGLLLWHLPKWLFELLISALRKIFASFSEKPGEKP